jgi:hypothetical protein
MTPAGLQPKLAEKNDLDQMTPAYLPPIFCDKPPEKNNMDQMTPQGSHEWVRYLPKGAVSIEKEGATLVLRASKTLQKRFETLLARRKAGTLSPAETYEYETICGLDTALSWLNRLARGARNS